MLSIPSSSPWQPLLVFNKLIYINNLQGCFWHLYCIFMKDSPSLANPFPLLCHHLTVVQTHTFTCEHTDVCAYKHAHIVLEAAVAAGPPLATGWCTLSLLYINATVPEPALPQWNAPTALSLRPRGYCASWLSAMWHETPTSQLSSAKRLMSGAIKSDFNIAFHVSFVELRVWHTLKDATHDSKLE